jgi:hypothetical protein
MSQDESPFASFVPSSPEVEAPAKAKDKKGGKARKKKAATRQVTNVVLQAGKPAEVTTTSAPKKARKPRTKKAPREIMLPASAILGIGGLNEVEVETVSVMMTSLQIVPKKSRAKVVAALAKIFA